MEQPETDGYMGFNKEEKDYLTTLVLIQGFFMLVALVIAAMVMCSYIDAVSNDMHSVMNDMHSVMDDMSNYYVYYSELTQDDMAELNDKISQAIPPTHIPNCKSIIYNTGTGTLACDGKVIAYVAKSHARP